MRIYLDLDSRRLLTTPTRPLTSLEFKRRDNDSIELQFLRDAAVQELPAGTTARVGIKPAGDYDAEFLAVTTLTQSGTGAATVYSGALNLHTTAMASAFTAEPVMVSAMLEVEWVTGDVVSSSKTLPTTIQNDVIRGDEGDPAELPIFYTAETSEFKATQAQAEDGADNATWMTPLRTAQAIAALGGASSWEDLEDKPSTFPPSAHTHTASQITDFSSAVAAVSPPVDWVSLTGKPSTFSPSTHTHDAGDIISGTLDYSVIPTGSGDFTVAPGNHGHGNINKFGAIGSASGVPIITGNSGVLQAGSFGTGSGTFCQGNDSRLSDSRTPTSHTHGNITNAGAIGTASGVPVITGANGVLQAGSFGTTAGTFAAGNHTHSGMLTGSGGITTIAVVSSMPASPVDTTLYIVTA